MGLKIEGLLKLMNIPTTKRPRWQCLTLCVAAGLGLAACGETIGTGPEVTGQDIAGPAREIAFVASGVQGVVSLIDVASQELIGEMDVIPDGRSVGLLRDWSQSLFGQALADRNGINFAQDIDISPDGRVMYISRGHLGDVAAFNLATRELMWRVPIAGIRSDHMTLSNDGTHLYVSALTADEVNVIDTTIGKNVGNFDTGNWPHDVHLSKDQSLVYNASIGNMLLEPESRRASDTLPQRLLGVPYQVTVAAAETLEIVEKHVFQEAIRPFVLSPDETKFYAQVSLTHDVIEYDFAGREISRRMTLPINDGIDDSDWDFEAPHHGLALTADGHTLCVAGRASDYAAIISTERFTPTAIIEIGDAPSWAVNTLDDTYCILANNRSDDVSFIAYASQREIARVAVGRAPKHIEVALVPITILEQLRSNQPPK